MNANVTSTHTYINQKLINKVIDGKKRFYSDFTSSGRT